MDDVVRAFLETEQKLRVVRRLGRGGFSEVYEVESPSGVCSAVKVSLDPIQADNLATKRELDNLNVVKAITGHPHIVTLMDYWLVANYLVTRWELAKEGSLLDKLAEYRKQRRKGIPEGMLLKWMEEAAEALEFLHSKGIYHRDIKPANLLLFHGYVKLADLGLAKVVGASTASHTGSGTIGYLPPEAWQERRLTPTADLYSLAATYVKLRTGEEPFGRELPGVFDRQRAGRPVVDGLQRREAELVCRALAARPEDRPQGGALAWVREVHEALHALQQRASSSRKLSKEFGADTTPVDNGEREDEGGHSHAGAPWLTTDTGALEGENALGFLFSLEGHSDEVTSACYSPEGRRIVTASRDGTAIVWDVSGI
jgi:serine/threonine protein kinase